MRFTKPLSDKEIEDRLLYRDGLILILNKPAGISVHRGPSGDPALEDSFGALRFGLPKPPALAHRLDHDTSGCLVLGRHAKALRKLGRLFSGSQVTKTYWAVVEGRPKSATGYIDAPLKKISEKKSGWRMIVDDGGQTARTHYCVLGEGAGKSWIAFQPQTGRTHQIRVHAAHMGCPIIGDWLYNSDNSGGKDRAQMHLHARAITLPLRQGKDPIHVEAPPPKHMEESLKNCGFDIDLNP